MCSRHTDLSGSTRIKTCKNIVNDHVKSTAVLMSRQWPSETSRSRIASLEVQANMVLKVLIWPSCTVKAFTAWFRSCLTNSIGFGRPRSKRVALRARQDSAGVFTTYLVFIAPNSALPIRCNIVECLRFGMNVSSGLKPFCSSRTALSGYPRIYQPNKLPA